MAQIGRTRVYYRSQERRFAKSAAFPEWITIPFVLLIGFMLWIGVLADPSGKMRRPSIGSILYTLAVIAIAAFPSFQRRRLYSSEPEASVLLVRWPHRVGKSMTTAINLLVSAVAMTDGTLRSHFTGPSG